MNTAMKLSALLILVLLGSLELVSSAEGANEGADCCTYYDKRKIPLAMVVSWHKTSSSCAKAAYVFVTKRGRHICVDPTHGWVRSHAGQVDSRSATIVVPGTSRINTKQESSSSSLCLQSPVKMNIALKLSALLILVLLGSLEHVSSTEGANTGADCCTSYYKMRIPLAKVVSWHKTSSSCAKAAYVFVTKPGKRICVDPAHGWVRSHAARVDSRSATTAVPGTSEMNTKA